jgi:hypothetical protein
VVLGVLLNLATFVGCSESRSSSAISRGKTADWSQIRLASTPPRAAYDAAVYAITQWFRLGETDPEQGLVQSVPSEYEQKGGTGRIRDSAIGYRNRMRRTGMVVVQEYDGGCIVKCKVAVQRLDTADHRVFRSNQQFEDVPNQTPIQEEAGVSPRQDQVWTDMPRDRGLERQILDVIRNRISPTNPEGQSPGPEKES